MGGRVITPSSAKGQRPEANQAGTRPSTLAPAQPWTMAWIWWPADHGHPRSHLFCVDQELWDSVPASSWGCCQGLSISLFLKKGMAWKGQPSHGHLLAKSPTCPSAWTLGSPTNREAQRQGSTHSAMPRSLLCRRQHGWGERHTRVCLFVF